MFDRGEANDIWFELSGGLKNRGFEKSVSLYFHSEASFYKKLQTDLTCFALGFQIQQF